MEITTINSDFHKDKAEKRRSNIKETTVEPGHKWKNEEVHFCYLFLNKDITDCRCLLISDVYKVVQKWKLLEKPILSENKCHKPTHLITSPAAVVEEYPAEAASLH